MATAIDGSNNGMMGNASVNAPIRASVRSFSQARRALTSSATTPLSPTKKVWDSKILPVPRDG